MSRILACFLALFTTFATAQYGSVRDQSSQSSTGQTTAGKPIPNHNVPKPPNATAGSASQNPTFKVSVKLVNVYTTVVDQHGAPIGNLKKEDFSVSEDGNPEKIALFQKESELPLSIVIAIDASGSTKKDLKLETDSARKFAKDILRPIDALSVYSFSEDINQIVPFTADLKRIDRGISEIQPGSATALYDTIYLASRDLMQRQGRKVMVLITDGGDTYSKYDYQQAMRAATQSEVLVYSIIMVPVEQSAGRDTGGEHALIQISKDTGGKHYYAAALDQLDVAFQQISDELRTQYLIGYYPSRRLASNDFRKIDVELSPTVPNANLLQVRHRSGYYTSPLE
ncbi:MAG TPA: VWA domain-containing protein [Candidatus Koribacter sp.]|jgi:Ca-activated chloride channel family protein